MAYKVYCATDGCKLKPVEGLHWDEALKVQAEHQREKPKHDMRIRAER